MCSGCRRLGFAEPSPLPDPEDNRVDEEQPQPQPQHFDRPAARKKLQPKPKTIHHTPDNADLTPMRPAWAYVFYDTTPGALNPGRAEDLARSIFDGTKNNRSSDGLPERIEVFAMPLLPLSETGSLFSAEELGLDLILS
ncbi:hypothetical protein CORC01_00720 [Colletotrichum orchidophilum]|uniref:Uncharacterized protein n=1 Tax=Colletotrichum orchidophilum TaxID=1209926 RepID=A0A1G4BR73_9PEZI|nr:uncharacterized protein CORC01_00720 [Colletotrichum orchidophilum]OHF03858.1 hypothetical protein CORC01_00720 [Colletotrichum orchidophilum]